MSLWYVDRSRYEAGTQECSWKRVLGNHFGPSGYGIARESESIPLATGSAVHEGTMHLGLWAKAHPGEVKLPLEVIRAAAHEAAKGYEARAKTRGMVVASSDPRVEEIIAEQSALIRGLVWVAGLQLFPWLLQDYEVMEVEMEEVLVLGCTCGLGDGVGDWHEHEARGCAGIGFMSRPDLLTRARQRPDSWQYWEYKTTGRITSAWRDSWETKIQFHAGVVATERRLGIRIDETYVVGLWKGDRRDDRHGVRRQNSVLCYGWHLPENPPLQEARWEALYDDPSRTPRRLSPKWEREPIWTQRFDWAVIEGEAAYDPVEYWVRWLNEDVRAQQIAIVGPYNRQDVLIDGFFRDLIPHEERWKETVWTMYDAMERAGWDWSAPEVQAAIGSMQQRSWACKKFGAEHTCQFKPLCFQHEGWQDPLGHGYVLRRPHHQPELDAALAAGVIPPEDASEESED